MSAGPPELAGQRVLITGAARGIGAATALRLHARGAHVALAGLEPELLEQVASECGDAPWAECDVADRGQVESAVELAVAALGGLDVVVANAGVAAQLPLVGGDPVVFEQTISVNVLGVYYTLRAAGPYISHPHGYALAVASLAAALHLPMMSAYCASKAAVEAIGDCMRIELRPSGARLGVAYFAELDTEMTSRGFGTEAAGRLFRRSSRFAGVAPLAAGIDAIERGIAARSRRIVAPPWVGRVLTVRSLAQRLVERTTPSDLEDALEIARRERAPLTTAQPTR